MTTETIRSVALEVIDNYRRAAKSTADAFRLGSAKSIAKVDSTLVDLMKYEGKISKKVKTSIETAGEKIASVADETAGRLEEKVKNTLTDTRKKIVSATNKADGAVDKYLSGASSKIAKFPSKGTRISRLLDSKVVATVEPLGIKGAKMLRYGTSTLADGAEKISNKVGSVKKAAPVKKAPIKAIVAKKAAPAKKTVAKVVVPRTKKVVA